MTNLKEVISQQQEENAFLVKKIGILSEKRINCKEMFQSNDMHQSYLSIMKEREKVIESLYSKFKKLNDQNVLKVNQDTNNFGILP